MLLSPNLRNCIVKSSKGPEFDEKELDHVMKHVKLSQKKTTSVTILKFLIKKHLEQAFLFESSLIKLYSECGYVVKFWGPLIEKAFKYSPIIPSLVIKGDTIPGSLLLLWTIAMVKLRKSPQCPSTSGIKEKTVVVSKALLNSVINENAINQEKDCVYIPYPIVMGFEMHLCIVFLKSKEKEEVLMIVSVVSQQNKRKCGTSKVVWDNVEDELED
ncbi:hypothetical protein BD560DRAFT_462565 [Blakeslea trispora]|nr:hypothetical protein BD560DRAFT_462565 [Blakeslea trispora]